MVAQLFIMSCTCVGDITVSVTDTPALRAECVFIMYNITWLYSWLLTKITGECRFFNYFGCQNILEVMEFFIVFDSSECKFLVRTLYVHADGHFI
jgi:hypothetical protein